MPVSYLQTVAAAAKARLIYQLAKSARAGASALDDIISGCSEATPCHSAACPVCSLNFQQVAVGLVDAFMIGPAQTIRGRKTAITLIPSTGCVAPGTLTPEVWNDVATEIETALAFIAAGPSLVGLEASFNEDLTGEKPSHCCVHGHGIMLDWLSKVQEDKLRAAFPTSQLVKRPVMVNPLDAQSEGKLYPFKSDRSRRETYRDVSNNDREPHRNTRKRPLRPHQAVELALVEHEVGFRRRLVSHGIDVEAINRAFDAFNCPRDGP